ncbi:EG45-like domain containing protein [Jatropha curcas]|uniref:EG45-like domain containing protein n=1 Tax=Jatropha curcas TaxID=180498 RepID=UPI00189554C7|nr:EG45-like domain containing protein [Jatropha curcas]
MSTAIRVAVMVGMVLCLASIANAAQGRAVWYKPPYTPSKCYGNQNNGLKVAGVSDALWNNGAACGRKYRVRCIGGANEAPHPCKGGSVDVTIVDYCSRGCQGDINLSQYAFSQIADTDAGIVRVQYDQI